MKIQNIDDAHLFAIVENEIREHFAQTHYENIDLRIEMFASNLFNVFVTFNIENFYYVEQFVQRYNYESQTITCVSYFNAYSIRDVVQFDQRVNNYKMYSLNKH